MASDQQVALARVQRASTSNLTKSTRQVVPAFLQKLYEMVNDPTNNDLIRWADAGDSFFVLDHERFAREVLGRWFKHQNFSSFVRQLNMYGFHKIPHLQQGVLKSEAETEFWNFEHANFRRGQPDLLAFIQRKKQAPQPNGNEDHLLEAAKDPNNPMAVNGSLSAGQLLDMNAIVNGITVIKRHQAAISTDLNDLKSSNQQLWQEALAARERHKKQQDTINRILKFLAGVFGQGSAPKHDGSHSPPAMMPRKRQRLMIGDMDRMDGKARAVEITDVDDEEDEEMHLRSPTSTDRGQSPFAGIPMATITTPMSTESTFSPPATEASLGYLNSGAHSGRNGSGPTTPVLTPANEQPRGIPSLGSPHVSGPDKQLGMNSHSVSQPNGTPSSKQPTSPLDTFPSQPQQEQGIPTSSYNPSTITSLTASNNANSDPAMMQAAFQQMLNQPAQVQRFFQALANGQNVPGYPMSMDPGQQSPYGRPTYNGPLDSQTQLQQYRLPTPGLYPPPPQPESSQLQRMDNSGIVEPLMQSADRLAKTYKDAAEIDADVDALQTSIYSLIENLGLDPSVLNTHPAQRVNGGVSPHMNGVHTNGVHVNGVGVNGVAQDHRPDSVSMPPPNGHIHLNGMNGDSSGNQDFDFESFLTEFSRDGADVNGDYGDFAEKLANHTPGINGNPAVQDASTEQLTAFLDEVASNASNPSDGTAPSPVGSSMHSPQLRAANASRPKAGQKRKSDSALMFVDQTQATVDGSTGGGTKTKRKK